MKYFRRPQTAFVNDDANLSQKPQSQWTLASTTTTTTTTTASEEAPPQPATNGNGVASLPADSSTEKEEEDKDATNDHDVEEITQSLETRLQLEVKHHPESVLLCGYFEEHVLEDNNHQKILTLSTYLPGVAAPELRVYYGQGVLKIAGARALYQVVQRFERSFAVEEGLVDASHFQAALEAGMLLIRVPLWDTPKPPLTIAVVEASPMVLFRHQSNKVVLDDIDVPGVALKDLTVEYDNGMIRLLWNRMEPMMVEDNPMEDDTTGDPLANAAPSSNTIQLQQVRYQRDIPVSTFCMDTTRIKAYLDCHSKPTNVLVITAPLVQKKMMPIQVQTR